MRKSAVALLLGALALGACDKGPTGTTPVSANEGAVVGRYSTASLAAEGPAYSASAAGGYTAAAARVEADGSLSVLASALVSLDGTYRIEGVPAGEDRLVVRITTDAGAEAGRVILHQAVAPQADMAAEPVTPETTVEARVYAELRRGGMSKEAINTVEMAQALRFDQTATAVAVGASEAELAAIAAGVKARQETYTRVLAKRGSYVDAKARFEASVAAAAALAAARHSGATQAEAEAELSAKVEAALAGKGVGAEQQLEASSASETGFLAAVSSASAQARLELAKNAARGNLQKREARMKAALGTAGATTAQSDAAAQAVAAARVQIDAAATVEGVAAAAAQAGVAAQKVWEEYLSQSGRIPAFWQTEWDIALQALPSESEIAAQIGLQAGVAVDVDAVATAYVTYTNAVRSAIEAAVLQARTAGSTLDGKATAAVYVSFRGSVQAR